MKLLWHQLRWFVSEANFTNRSMLMLYLPFRHPCMNSKSLISCQYVSDKRFVHDKTLCMEQSDLECQVYNLSPSSALFQLRM